MKLTKFLCYAGLSLLGAGPLQAADTAAGGAPAEKVFRYAFRVAETGFDPGWAAPRVQADRQGAMTVDAASPAKAAMEWIKRDPLRAPKRKSSKRERDPRESGHRQRLPATDERCIGARHREHR